MIPLCREIRALGKHITIETAGTLYLRVTCDLMSISPKLSNSTPSPEIAPAWHARHERTRHAPEVIRRLAAEYAYQFKFVIRELRDCEEVAEYLSQFPEIDRSRVMLMPMGTTVEELSQIARWLEPYCLEHGLHYCPRRQIEWFGYTRGT
jgi:7-carboxy-7-deazaguanine synthase